MPNCREALAEQLLAEGPTKAQRRIASRVRDYDSRGKNGKSSQTRRKPSKKERRIASAVLHQDKLDGRQANMVTKNNRRTNRSNAVALLDILTHRRDTTAPLQFGGEVIIQAREEAIQAAAEASSAAFDPHHYVLFASGASVPARRATKEGKHIRSAGTAVVYKRAATDNAANVWGKERSGLGQLAKNAAGFVAIAEALSLVATGIASAEDRDAKYKATIFSDNQAALRQIRYLNYDEQTGGGTPGVEKLITRSQYLDYVGVHVELRWSPNQGSQGMKRAATAARKVAPSHMECKFGDSLDEGLQLVVDSISCHDNEEQSSPTNDINRVEPDHLCPLCQTNTFNPQTKQ